jgi:hypothetical protein
LFWQVETAECDDAFGGENRSCYNENDFNRANPGSRLGGFPFVRPAKVKLRAAFGTARLIPVILMTAMAAED